MRWWMKSHPSLVKICLIAMHRVLLKSHPRWQYSPPSDCLLLHGLKWYCHQGNILWDINSMVNKFLSNCIVTPPNLHNHFHVFFADLWEDNQRLIIHSDSLYSINTRFIIGQIVGNRSNLLSGTNSKVSNKIVRLPKSVCSVMRSHLRARRKELLFLNCFYLYLNVLDSISPSLAHKELLFLKSA